MVKELDRRQFLKGVGLAVATWPFAGCIRPDSRPSASIPQTITPPLSTPETTVVTVPSTTTQEPTTTLEPKPNDVVEHRDGYDVLMNGGYHYEIATEPWFGGYELHLRDGQQTYGFRSDGDAQYIILNGLLDAFGAQHPEFKNQDGSVNKDAYRAYLESQNGRDMVSIPQNTYPEGKDVSYPPVVPSSELLVDLSLPVVFIGGNYSFSDDAKFTSIQYYRHTPDSFGHAFIGLTDSGQLYVGIAGRDSKGTLKDQFSPYDFSVALAILFGITANINNATYEPQERWLKPFWNTIIPFGTIPSDLYTSGLTTVDITEYGEFPTAESKIFSKV